MDSKDTNCDIKIKATLSLSFEDKSVDENEILKLVGQNTHFLIKYDDSDYVHSPEIDGKGYELRPSKGCRRINTGVKKNHNVYFIFDSDDKNLLYIGKSKSIRTRLRNHLICCAKSTSSKIQKIKEFLEGTEKKQLYYYSIEVSDSKYYGSVEGSLIAYIKTHERDFPNNWNDRED